MYSRPSPYGLNVSQDRLHALTHRASRGQGKTTQARKLLATVYRRFTEGDTADLVAAKGAPPVVEVLAAPVAWSAAMQFATAAAARRPDGVRSGSFLTSHGSTSDGEDGVLGAVTHA
jgi:hypothetical protein